MVSKRFEGVFTVEWQNQKEECHIKERNEAQFFKRLNEAREEIFKHIPKDTHVKTRYRGDFAEKLADALRDKGGKVIMK